MTFQTEIKNLMKKHKLEGTPVMTLAEFVQDCVAAYDSHIRVVIDPIKKVANDHK